MRIVASVCLVLAILLMVGCQQMTEQQKADLAKISAIEAKANAAAPMQAATEMKAKLDAIEKFLNDKAATGLKTTLADYGKPPEVKPPEAGKKPGEAPKKEEPKKAEPTGGAKKGEPKKGAGTGKGG